MLHTRTCVLMLLLIAGCAAIGASQLDARYGSPSPREPGIGGDAADYQTNIRPLLEARCTVCHGCYDAPCQLKLDATEGLLRGASKNKVYDGTRLMGAELTRLFQDAGSTAAWREKDFFPVINERANTAEANLAGSVMAQLLLLKQQHPLPHSPVLPDSFDFATDRDQQCPRAEEFDGYASDYPLWGMPYGLPALSAQEHDTLIQWLESGAQIGAEPGVPPKLLKMLADWETFFNGNDTKSQLINRYLYEHLFLAGLYFDAAPDTVFRLVRSRTPPGQPIERIASRRPFDDPKVERVYYRLWQDPSTRLAKTHMPYRLHPERMANWRRWFYAPEYEVTALPGYTPEVAANPFARGCPLPVFAGRSRVHHHELYQRASVSRPGGAQCDSGPLLGIFSLPRHP